MTAIFSVVLVWSFILIIFTHEEYKKRSSFAVIIFSLATSLSTVVFILDAILKKVITTLNLGPLLYINLLLICFSLVVWLFSRERLETDKSSFLVDLVGAWNKIDIDNSIDNLTQHGINNPDDREWCLEMIKILKNYKDDKPVVLNKENSAAQNEIIKQEESLNK